MSRSKKFNWLLLLSLCRQHRSSRSYTVTADTPQPIKIQSWLTKNWRSLTKLSKSKLTQLFAEPGILAKSLLKTRPRIKNPNRNFTRHAGDFPTETERNDTLRQQSVNRLNPLFLPAFPGNSTTLIRRGPPASHFPSVGSLPHAQSMMKLMLAAACILRNFC